MRTEHWFARAALIAAALALSACSPPPPHDALVAESEDGVRGYLGVVSSVVTAAHAPGHVEQRMHAGAPRGNTHIMVALFDSAGNRIEDAAVEAEVRSARHGGARRLRLDPMRINDAVTYGGFVSLTDGLYHVDVSIRRPGETAASRLRFALRAPQAEAQ
ncbi:MAG: hypothetical protein HXY28_13630 [Hydrogenophilaceae bacterium]|jgi:hypothetical protein|nr:hypothetical protein [Hydrogenophilaceae bacterium]